MSKQTTWGECSLSDVIALDDFAAEWVLETRRMVPGGEENQPRFRTVMDKDGQAWWIWKRHIQNETYYPTAFKNEPMDNPGAPHYRWAEVAHLKEKLVPYTLEHCIEDWHKTIREVPAVLSVAIDPANHRIRNVNTGEVIPCAALA